VVRDQPLELWNERRVATQRDLGVDPILQRDQAQLLEPTDLVPRELLEREVCERLSAP
jgi:hypothetical protein